MLFRSAHHLVLVRSDVFAENAERRVAIAFLDVTEDLVVSPVLLDDIDDVLEHAWLADALRHRTRRLVGPRRQSRGLNRGMTEVVQRRPRMVYQLPPRRHGDERERSEILAGLELRLLARFKLLRRAKALDVRDAK